MLKKLATLALVVSLLLGYGCVTPTIDSPTSNDQGPTLVSKDLKDNVALVRVEFVLSLEDKEKYPEAFEAFKSAVREWVEVVPVEISILIPKKDSDMTVASVVRARRGAIVLDFTSTIWAPAGVNYLGTFSWHGNKLQLDMGDFYKPEFNFDLAKVVAMHELGHVFGLTHVYNTGDLRATPGSLIVLSGADKMLMFPSLPRGYEDLKISEAEIEYAIQYVQSILSTKLYGL